MFELATPWVLILIIIPLMIWLLIPRASSSASRALRIPFFNTLEPMLVTHASKRKSTLLYFFCIWSLLVFALSGPKLVGPPLQLPHEGHNIMLVLDISGSMEIRDRMHHGQVTSRLSLVKNAAEKFVKNRKHDQIGLILFGTRAYLQTPLTYDHKAVLMRLEDATVGLAGKTTSIGDALGLAVKHMQNIPKAGRVIILLTDGANNSGTLLPLKAAKIAKDEDIKIYTIGLSSEGLPVFGQVPMVDDLDEHTLQTIADMTGGHYFHATDMQSLTRTYQRINQLETVKHPEATARPEKSYYPYPAAFALFLLMMWFTRRLVA